MRGSPAGATRATTDSPIDRSTGRATCDCRAPMKPKTAMPIATAERPRSAMVVGLMRAVLALGGVFGVSACSGLRAFRDAGAGIAAENVPALR